MVKTLNEEKQITPETMDNLIFKPVKHKIKKQMQSNRSFKVIIVAIGNGINVLINFLTLPYLVRSLSFDDYGTYGQVLMIITILQGFFTYNLNQIANLKL